MLVGDKLIYLARSDCGTPTQIGEGYINAECDWIEWVWGMEKVQCMWRFLERKEAEGT